MGKGQREIFTSSPRPLGKAGWWRGRLLPTYDAGQAWHGTAQEQGIREPRSSYTRLALSIIIAKLKVFF